MAPNFVIPDYSMVARRGDIIAKGIQDAFGIIGSITTSAIDEYKMNRNLETAYKGVRADILNNQQKYGLDDKQAQAMMSRLKFKDKETIDDYEKRIAPTLLNMKLWEKYQEDPNYKIDLPDPFVPTQSFVAMLDLSKDIKDRKQIGEAVQEELFSGKMKLPEMAQQNPEFVGPPRPEMQQPPQTKEEFTGRIAGRLGGGYPVPEQKLEQYPGYRALPSQEDASKQELYQANIGKVQAQTQAADALTRKRNTADIIQKLKASEDKKNSVNDIKDLNTIARAEIYSREALKNMPKEDENGNISEDWIDMKELTEVLKDKRMELSGKKKPSMESKGEAIGIQEQIQTQFPNTGKIPPDQTEVLQETANKINQKALSKGVQIDYNRIIMALKQGERVSDIIDRVNQAAQMRKGVQRPSMGIAGKRE